MQEPTKAEVEAILSLLLGREITLDGPETATTEPVADAFAESVQSKVLRAKLQEGFTAIDNDRELAHLKLEELHAQVEAIEAEIDRGEHALVAMDIIQNDLVKVLQRKEITQADFEDYVFNALQTIGN